MLIRNRLILSFALATFALFSVAASAASAEDAPAMQRTKALIAAFKQVKRAPEGKGLSAADMAANEKTFVALDGFLAGKVLSGAPVKPHEAAFKPDELKTFKDLFWKTLRFVAYPDSGLFFEEAKYTLFAPVVNGARTDVKMHAELEADDIETDVVFHWQMVDGTLQVVDISFDDASLVTDYTNQFGRIIKKKGAKGLIEILQKKHDAVKKALGYK